ncbi:hypothetical protein [Psychromonas aquimarina]|uniref:hypothetical protein n=1 Tax=Psychromonas aquimarina TaxID=444919 RepID=UPI00048E9C0F|nr:hypothetical protein [Psychromonas aquimarina]
MSLGKLLLYIFVIGMASAVILPSIMGPRGSGTSIKTSDTSIKISQGEVNSCLNRIHENTMYDKDRLNYIGNDGRSIIVTYLNDMGKTHKFMCDGNKVKLWAKGAGMWMDM